MSIKKDKLFLYAFHLKVKIILIQFYKAVYKFKSSFYKNNSKKKVENEWKTKHNKYRDFTANLYSAILNIQLIFNRWIFFQCFCVVQVWALFNKLLVWATSKVQNENNKINCSLNFLLYQTEINVLLEKLHSLHVSIKPKSKKYYH